MSVWKIADFRPPKWPKETSLTIFVKGITKNPQNEVVCFAGVNWRH
jgi:hypothetical protein